MATSFDAWYASLPPLNVFLEAPSLCPPTRLSTAWENYLNAINWLKEELGPSSSRHDGYSSAAEEYERELITSVAGDNEQIVMACRAALNHALLRLSLDVARGHKYAEVGITIDCLEPDIMYRRESVMKAHAELVYITEAMQAIALGAEPPVPSAAVSPILQSYVSDAATMS
jgi:hypothetical protein